MSHYCVRLPPLEELRWMGIDRDISACCLCRGGESLDGSKIVRSSVASGGCAWVMTVWDTKETKVTKRN
jgi:hypothetical protein